MKVVIATPFYPPQVGVLATYAAGIEGALKRQGHEVETIVLNTSLPTGMRHVAFALRVFTALRGASFVLSLDTWSVGLPTCLAAMLRRKPLVVRIGGDFLWEQYIERTGDMVRLSDFYSLHKTLSFREKRIRALIAWLLRSSSHIFFNTSFQREIWSHAYHISTARSSVLENFYPPRVGTAAPERRVFVSANRGARYKNSALLKSAFDRVRASHPEIELDTRELPHDAQLARLSSAYAVIIPSVTEVGSNIAIESVSRGRPFITTEDTGTKERLEECGLFVDTRSEDELARAIERMLEPETYDRLAKSAREFSFVRTWDDIAKDMLRVAEQI